MASKKFYVDIATQTNVRITGDAIDNVNVTNGSSRLVTGNAVYDFVTGQGYTTFDGAYSSLTGIPATFAPSAHTHSAAQIDSGTFANARISSASVTQHEGDLSIAYSQLTSVPTTFAPSAHTHAAGDITSGTFANARVAAGNVTQHQGSLEYANSLAFNTSTGVISLGRNVGSNLTVDIDGRYAYSDQGGYTFGKNLSAVTSTTIAGGYVNDGTIVQVYDSNAQLVDCKIVKDVTNQEIDLEFDVAFTGRVCFYTPAVVNEL